MPGIFGIVSPSAEQGVVASALEAMALSMHHRRTYQVWMASRGGVGIGRIGPSFLNPEPQPVYSGDGNLAIVFEGELYDPDSVRKLVTDGPPLGADAPDAEIVLRAVESQGTAVIPKLAGAYAGFIYDFRKRTGTLFVDRLGLRGCYWTITESGTFLFAAEVKAIVAAPEFRGTLDVRALMEFLQCGAVLFDKTFFKEIQFLPHAGVLKLTEGRATVEQYWGMEGGLSTADWTFQDAVDEGVRRWLAAVGRQFRQQGPIGALLSGGVDSRAMVAASAAMGHTVTTFSLGWQDSWDKELAGRLARRLGLPNRRLSIHSDFLVRVGETGIYYTDGMFPCSHLHWMEHLDSIGREVRAVQTGYMGNANLGGCYRIAPELQGKTVQQRGHALAARVLGEWSPFLAMALRPDVYREVQERFGEAPEEFIARVAERPENDAASRIFLATKERRFVNLGNSGMLGVVADIKYPFGDYDLLDYTYSLPLEWRAKLRLYQAIIGKAFPQILDIPCISSKTDHLPTRLRTDGKPMGANPLRAKWAEARKWGRFMLGRLSRGGISLPNPSTYVQYAYWYRTVPAFREWIESVLLDERTLDRGYYDRNGIRRLLEMMMRRGYPLDFLAYLVTFEFWNRHFVDRHVPEGARVPMPSD